MKYLILSTLIIFSQLSLAKNHQNEVSFKGQVLQENAAELYKDFGLKAGETIVMFDGKPLASPKDAMTLYQGIKKKSIKQILVKSGDGFRLVSHIK